MEGKRRENQMFWIGIKSVFFWTRGKHACVRGEKKVKILIIKLNSGFYPKDGHTSGFYPDSCIYVCVCIHTHMHMYICMHV